MPRYDMVDISNNNGYISVATFRAMKAKGVKAVIAKVSEGTYFQDGLAKSNLARAKSVGLVIHAYHFARFTTVYGAQAEARFAVNCAKAAGLPIGHVLVCDFESYNKGWAQNNATTKAFAKIVKAAGYRYDLYTMGSWVNSVSINNSGRAGWIANYPYSATGKRYYSDYNSWQWTSSATFLGSGSRFDVSVNWSDFYFAGGATALKPKSTGTYFDWTPKWIYPKYQVAAYKTASAVGTGKGVVKTYKPLTQLHVKRLVKSGSSKVTRFELTNGLYITASKDYINNLYYTNAKKRVKVVKSVRGTGKYTSKKFDDKHLKQKYVAGTEFDVVKVVTVGEVSRLLLADGTYISGNKLINKFIA